MSESEKVVSPAEYEAISSNRGGHHKKQVTVTSKSIMTVVGVILLCGLSFWGGIAYQKHNTKSATPAMLGTQNGFNNGQGFARRGGGVGSVTAVGTDSLTIDNQRSGSSETYTVSSSTTISDNGQTVTLSDIKTGDTVMVMTSGSTSKAATRILVNPSFGTQPDDQSTNSL